MNCSITKKAGILLMAMMGCMSAAYPQCGFTTTQSSGCVGFILNLQDTTTGVGTTSTNWTVIFPGNDTIITTNYYQFGQRTTAPGPIKIIMTDVVNGHSCTVVSTSDTAYPNPVIMGSFNTTVTCAGNCVKWLDASQAGPGAYIDSFAMDWNNSTSLDITRVPPQCETYNSAGPHSQSLVIYNNYGCKADTQFVNSVTVGAPPPSTFTGGPIQTCVSPVPGTFTAPATANTRYSWYISTGAFSATPTQSGGSNVFTHSYTVGVWNVKCVAIDTLSGCTDSTIQNAYVNAGSFQAACFTASNTGGCAGNFIYLTPCTSGATYYNWTITGGINGSHAPSAQNNTTQAALPVYFYDSGFYTPCLAVGFPGGCSDTLCYPNLIKLGQQYTLGITRANPADSESCSLPQQVCVNYTGQACASCTFSWQPSSNTTPSSHTGTCYNVTSYGVLSPTLSVTDPEGCQSSIVYTDAFTEQQIQARVSTNQTPTANGCAGEVVTVVNNSTGGPFTSAVWSFPNATVVSETSSQAQVAYGLGCHNFTLTVQNAEGCTATVTDSICMHTAPTVSMTVGPPAMCFELQKDTFVVSVAPGSDTPTVVTVWPQGVPGPTFTIDPPQYGLYQYEYQSYGNYVVCFQASAGGCASDTICLVNDTIHIYPPIPSFSALTSCINPDTIIYTNTSVGADSSFWTFNGVFEGSGTTLRQGFAQCGTNYSVCVTAINDTTHCVLTKCDSTASVPCVGAGLRFADTVGCYFAFCSPANIFYTVPNAAVPTQVLWSSVATGSPPLFTGPSGANIACFTLYSSAVYDICAQLTYASGCIDTVCRDHYVTISQPMASYTQSAGSGCIPFCVTFVNTSTVVNGSPARAIWSFGDGTTDTILAAGGVFAHDSVTHCYDQVAQFHVCLTLIDSNGCSNQACTTIEADSLSASITASSAITCTLNASPLNPVTYSSTSTGFITQYSWILDPALGPQPSSISGNNNSITEQYTIPGTGYIGLTVSDASGACTSTAYLPVTVANPVANYTIPSLSDTFNPCPPITLCFTDSSQNDIASYQWYWSDGNPVDVQQNPCHIWTNPGTYPVTEIVTSRHGCTDTLTKYDITIAGPVVHVTSRTSGGCPCLIDTFFISSIGADSLYFNSNNGSGINGRPNFVNLVIPVGIATHPTLDTVIITYCETGDIRPAITTHSTTCNDHLFDSVIVSAPVDTPIIAFSYTLGSCGSDSVCFSNLTTFSAQFAYDSINKWNFGDGSPIDTVSNPCHHFPGPGDYTVSLTVHDQLPCSNTYSLTQKVHVPTLPVVSFTVNDSVVCAPFDVVFTNTSVVDDSSTTRTTGYWNFADGSPFAYTTADTSHDYNLGGIDTAKLIVIDKYGCSDSAYHVITVQAAPIVAVGQTQTICLGDTATLTGSGSSTLLWITDYNIDNTSSGTPRVWPQRDTCYTLRIGFLPACYVYATQCVNVSSIALTTSPAVNLCQGNTTAFSASATTTHATISGYTWAFGDGSTPVAGQAATHIYATSGTYSDTVLVINSQGCRDSAINSVTIFGLPTASFTLSLDTVCPNTPIIFTNTSTANPTGGALAGFTFDAFPTGSFTTQTAPFSYTAPGLYHDTLFQTDANGCIDTATKTVLVEPVPPVVNTSTTICNGDTITLSSPAGNTILWLTNYNISSTTAASPRVWPATDTQYIVQLGTLPTCYVYDTSTVLISTITATANPVSPACLHTASTYTATAQAVNATVSTYNWSFGDGSTGTGATVNHTFSAYGTYPDTLTVISSLGCRDTVYGSATVYDLPKASFTQSADSVCLGLPISVTNTSIAGASAALTTFYFYPGFPPDLTTTTASFTIPAPGVDVIYLVQTDANGCVDTAKGQVLVHNLPVANFNNGPGCTNVANPYTSSSTPGDGPIVSYNWNFNGNPLGIDSSFVTMQYSTAGTEQVCLSVQDVYGCVGDTCQTITIYSVPPDTVSPLDTTICAGYSASFRVTNLPTPGGSVQWVPATWVSDATDTDVTITPLQTIQYQVYSYFLQCVPKVDTVTIYVIDSVPVSATCDPQNIVLGLSSTITPTIKGTIDSIIWSPDSTLTCSHCMNPIATPHQTTTYTATIFYHKDNVTCTNTATVTVTVFTSCNGSLIYVPNTFTPNNDGVDDVFKLYGQGINVVTYFRVYDRWGKKVFEADNANNVDNAAWNGGLNNDELNKPENSGVFVYEFEIQCVTGQSVTGKGSVTLIK